MPDFTDQYDDHLVPLAALTIGDGNVSGSAANLFESISGWSAIAYTVAALAVIILAVLDYRGRPAVHCNQRIGAVNWPDPYLSRNAAAAIAVADSTSRVG